MFGKRKSPGENSSGHGSGDGNDGSTDPHIQRLIDRLTVMFNATSALARDIRINQWHGLGGAVDPMTSPVDCSGFSDLFQKTDDTGKSRFNYYFYLNFDEKLDPNAQIHISDMIGNFLILNPIANPRDERGPVAIDPVQIAPLIDRALVQSAFFLAFFSNHRESEAIGLDMMTTRSFSEAKIKGMLENMTTRLQFYINRAQKSMFKPETMKEHSPNPIWPILSFEMGAASHEGEKVINEVYFPKQYAEPFMSHIAKQQASALGQLYSDRDKLSRS